MDTLSRRKFLLAAGVTGAVGLTAGAGAVTWSDLRSRARTDPLGAGDRVLVVVTLYGGNDGINTLVPYADPAYHDARPELAYSPSEVLQLDSQLGLNPGLPGLHTLWGKKQLAVVRGVGYPTPDHSHFRSMDIWQTASTSNQVTSGWIGRWLDATGDDPLRAVSIGSVLPVLAVGKKGTAASLPAGPFMDLPGATAGVVQALGTSDRADSAAEASVCAAYRAERAVAGVFSRLASPGPGGASPGAGSRTKSRPGGNPLADQLTVVATAIMSGVPTKAWAVSLGGFDTHSDEKATQQTLLATIDSAISGFFTTLGNHPNAPGVVMMVHSEFGRRVQANASQGTDHGTAAPMFVIGAPVRGGFHGEQPSLTDLDDGDLKATVDFRAVYGEMLTGVLGTDPHAVLDTVPPALGLLA